MLSLKICGCNKKFGPKNDGSKKFWSNKILVQRNFWSKKKDMVQKGLAPIILGPKILNKIGSVAAEMFLIWTNVARMNVV